MRLYYCSDHNNIDKEIQQSHNYRFVHGNLQSFDIVKFIFQTNEISHVIHFAAQSHVQNSFEDSIQYTKDNIVGTHCLLEANRLYNPHLKKFIHVSTDEVYGESLLDEKEIQKTEHSLLCPSNPYAATKAGAEMIAQSYYHSFKMPIVITRGNNVYGPNQYPEKVVPKFIDLLQKGKKVTIQGDGSCVRAFLHAFDTATAFEKFYLEETSVKYTTLDVMKIWNTVLWMLRKFSSKIFTTLQNMTHGLNTLMTAHSMTKDITLATKNLKILDGQSQFILKTESKTQSNISKYK